MKTAFSPNAIKIKRKIISNRVSFTVMTVISRLLYFAQEHQIALAAFKDENLLHSAQHKTINAERHSCQVVLLL